MNRAVSKEFANYRHDQVVEECAVFLLCQALRKIFVENLLDEIADRNRWLKRLESKRPIS